ERPETPPNPSAIIPFGRDLDFVQRGKFLDQIHQACTEPDSRIALVGLGGVGKSQIAIEYAYQVRERSPETWVFWVHASNAARYEQSFREIADYLKIPGRQKPKSNIFQLLGSWLRNEAKGKWILVLDNVDEPSFLLEDPTAAQNGQASGLDSRNAQPLLSYLPHCPNGSILITTRSRDAALKLVESRDIIAVEPMDQADASALARKKLEKDEDKEGATALAVALECMPLAIVQATAYISQRAPRCTVQDYLEKFQNSDHKKASLLKYEGGQIRRDYEAKNSIIITWQISFDHIRQFRPSAADLLSLMSFFDRQGIPESLLRSRSEERRVVHDHDSPSTDDTDIEDIESNSSDGDGFENDVVTLRDYSFISINKDKTSFEMHSLVQIATRICRWEAAEKLFIKVIKRNKQKLGADHPDTLTSMANLASTYQKQGRWKEAEKLEVEVMETRKQKLGADHPSTLTSMNNLALTLHGLGQHAKAISLMKRCLQIGTQNFGDQHPNMSSSTRILARWEAEASLNDIGLGMDE
ncbi:P-loop containing nucleoside triphosphate hydrolase protein, partial [Pseudomassariella vexata]